MTQPITVVCFGEVLWDIFPEGQRAGGAPFNVAYNLSRLGINVHMISRVGADQLGSELIAKINSWKIDSKGIQIDPVHPTSTVVASFDERNEAHYQIIENVAWDYIITTPADIEMVQSADALVLGSLATRSDVTQKTIFTLMEQSKFKVFDINLRPPFVAVNTIKEILHKVHLAKFNKAELRLVLEFLGKDYVDENDSIKYIQDTFQLNEIIVSKGSRGAIYYNESAHYQYPAVTIQIKDTVGSGDSFLAGFLSKRLAGASGAEIMEQATSLGAFITSKEGACPDYDMADFTHFKQNHPIQKELIITNQS